MSEAHYARIAALYDTFVKTDYDVAFFLSEAAQREGPILELMAGTGRLTLPLLEAGYAVTCVDFSAEMLAVLRQKLATRSLPAVVHQADVRTFNLNHLYNLIVLPFQAFPELTSEADQLQALERIRARLAPEGVFICTLHNPTLRRKSVDGQLRLASRQELADGGQLLVWLLQSYAATPNVVEVYEFFEAYDGAGLLQSKRYSLLTFSLLEKAVFERMLAQAGLEVVNLYGDYARSAFDVETSPFMIWVLKPTTN